MKKQSEKVYKVREGFRVKGDAQAIGERLEKIAEKHGGELPPVAVVADARKESSPLHNSFTWDDTEAAKQWRIEQARRLIRSFEVTYMDSRDDTETTHQVFVNLYENNTPSKPYERLEDVFNDPVRRHSYLLLALCELRSFKEKYKRLTELSRIFDEIDRLESRSKKKDPQ